MNVIATVDPSRWRAGRPSAEREAIFTLDLEREAIVTFVVPRRSRYWCPRSAGGAHGEM